MTGDIGAVDFATSPTSMKNLNQPKILPLFGPTNDTNYRNGRDLRLFKTK